jgi:hypothetical protein
MHRAACALIIIIGTALLNVKANRAFWLKNKSHHGYRRRLHDDVLHVLQQMMRAPKQTLAQRKFEHAADTELKSRADDGGG